MRLGLKSLCYCFYCLLFFGFIAFYSMFTRVKSPSPKILYTNVQIPNYILTYSNQSFETTIECRGHPYNQSCLFKNLYYTDSQFIVLTVNGSYLPSYSVKTNMFDYEGILPAKRVFSTYSQLETFVQYTIHPTVIPSLTLHFHQLWHHNIGHALFDGLYPAYVGLIRFSPKHLQPFRILAGLDNSNTCWSEDVYSRFSGLGLLKLDVLKAMSITRWFMFEELVMGGGVMCQRCTQPNLQLSGGVELDAARLFRDRMYRQHGLLPVIVRKNSSAQHRTSRDILQAFIIDNKRYTDEDRKQLNDAISAINNYTFSFRNQTIKLQWPLINVTYLHYGDIKPQQSPIEINATKTSIHSSADELIENNFIAQLKILRQMDIHISGPGTGQMYQTLLSDGSVNINLGGLGPVDYRKGNYSYASFLEQHMTSGAPYIKGLYYPINERIKGIQKDEVVKLIRQAGQLIMEGFSLPVNPQENLAADGRLFVEMCQKDEKFCSLVTNRTPQSLYHCLNLWVEDFVHENGQWSENGFVDKGQTLKCLFDRQLLRELRTKYGIKHNSNA